MKNDQMFATELVPGKLARAPLLLLELFQFVRCVLIFGIELDGFAIVGNGQLFLTVLRIGLGHDHEQHEDPGDGVSLRRS